MLNTLVEIIRDLIPHKDLPNNIYISRLFVICALLYTNLFLILTLFRGTEIANRYGLNPIVEQPALTYYSFTRLTRVASGNLQEIVYSNENISSAFLVKYYDPETEEFQLEPKEGDEPLIWVSEHRGNYRLKLANLEKTIFTPKFSLVKFDNTDCNSTILPLDVVEQINTILNLESATVNSILTCPVFIPKNSVPVAQTVVFFSNNQESPNPISTSRLIGDVVDKNSGLTTWYSYFKNKYNLKTRSKSQN